MVRNSTSFFRWLGISVDALCELQATHTSERFSSLQGRVAQYCTAGQNAELSRCSDCESSVKF